MSLLCGPNEPPHTVQFTEIDTPCILSRGVSGISEQNHFSYPRFMLQHLASPLKLARPVVFFAVIKTREIWFASIYIQQALCVCLYKES